MSDEPQEQAENRNEDGTFKSGESGNPGGRPKGSLSMKARMEKMLNLPLLDAPEMYQKLARKAGFSEEQMKDMTVMDVAVLTTITGCMQGKSTSVQEVWNRMEGKVKDNQEVDVTVKYYQDLPKEDV